MTYFIEQLGKARWWLLAFLITVSPFHAFLVTWLKIPGLPVWREVIVVLICAIIAGELLIKRLSKLKIKNSSFNHHSSFVIHNFDILDLLILGFALLGLFFLPFQLSRLPQWALGMRFDVMPFLFFVFLRRVEWPKKEILVRMALGAASIVLIFGLLQALVLPQNFLTRFGYSLQQGPFNLEQPISGCQYLEHTSSVCRATSTFASPMRYGSYLLLLIGLLAPFLVQKRTGPFVFLGLLLANLFLTYSRAAWIGGLVIGVCAAIWGMNALRKSEKGRLLMRRVFAFLTVSIVLIGIVFAFTINGTREGRDAAPGLLKTIFVRASSSTEHFQYMKEGVEQILTHPLGNGLGTAGPASLRFEKFVTENWYLQIGVEMGVLGMALFIAILAVFAKTLRKSWRAPLDQNRTAEIARLSRGLFLALLGISAMGLFIHSFEETSAMLAFAAFAAFAIPRISSSAA